MFTSRSWCFNCFTMFNTLFQCLVSQATIGIVTCSPALSPTARHQSLQGSVIMPQKWSHSYLDKLLAEWKLELLCAWKTISKGAWPCKGGIKVCKHICVCSEASLESIRYGKLESGSPWEVQQFLQIICKISGAWKVALDLVRLTEKAGSFPPPQAPPPRSLKVVESICKYLQTHWSSQTVY